MRLKYLFYVFVLGTAFTACSKDETLGNDSADQQAKVTLKLSGTTAIVKSRTVSEMPLEDANLMYNLLLLHYNSNQTLIEVKYNDDSDLAQGKFEQTWSPTLTVGSDDYIVLLANVKQTNDALDQMMTWITMGASRFANLSQAMKIALPLMTGSDGSYNSKMKMYMLGYYHGAVTNGMNLNISMGRMAACLKMVITSNSEANISKVEINNAVMNTHYFPAASSDDLTFGTYTDNIVSNNTVSPTSSMTLYYYTGENMNPSSSHYTTAKITATTGGGTTYQYNNTGTAPGGYVLDQSTDASNYVTGYYVTSKYKSGSNTTNVGFYAHKWAYDVLWSTYYKYADSQPSSRWYLVDSTTDTYYFAGYNVTENGTTNYYKYRYSKTIPGTAKTYTIVLGSEPPGTADRNYSLYRNNTYTFNINLK